MTVLAFILALAVLITVHEWGHYRVAVALGVRVEQFSIGFGPALFKRKSHQHGQDIEFIVGAIPLGGYVRMLDSEDPALAPEQRHMALNAKPLWARACIVLAGPLANLVLAIALSVTVFWMGQFETKAVLAMPQMGSPAQMAGLKSGDVVLAVGTSQNEVQSIASMDDLRWWALGQDFANHDVTLQILSAQTGRTHGLVIPAFDPKNNQGLEALGIGAALSAPVLGQVQDATPAQAAGLLPGDTVLSIDGLAFHDAMMLRQFIRQSAALGDPAPQEWRIDRPQHGQMTLVVTPTRVATDAGYIGRVGVQIGSLPEQVWVQYGVTEGLIKGVNHALDIVSITLHGIWQMVLGEASAKSLTGPLGVAEFAGQAAEIGVAAYLSYLSIISVSLFVLNMLPLPMLDGGHLMYYLLEAVRGRALSPHTLGVMQRIGLCLIVALMIFTFFNDLERMGWLKLF